MIRLEIEKWCHNCPNFEPKIAKENLYSDEFANCFSKRITDTKITCVHSDRCTDQLNYLIRAFRNGDIK